MRKRKLIFNLTLVLEAIVFILLPLSPSDLYIRLHFEEIAGDYCALYYTTDTSGYYSDEQCVLAQIEPETNQVSFCLDRSLAGHITGLRLDFPPVEDLVGIKSVTLSSAGIIQKEYNPCHFFAASHIKYAHEAGITLVKPRNRAYIETGSDDPYLILADDLTEQIQDCYSHFRLTRLLICLFAFGCCFFAQKKLFSEK